MLFLQLEAALSDARAELEKAGEALHDASVQAAQRRAEYDAKGDVVRRLEGALSALHGDVAASSAVAVQPSAAPRKVKPKPEGPVCPGCGEIGTLVRQGPMIVCTACQAQSVG